MAPDHAREEHGVPQWGPSVAENAWAYNATSESKVQYYGAPDAAGATGAATPPDDSTTPKKDDLMSKILSTPPFLSNYVSWISHQFNVSDQTSLVGIYSLSLIIILLVLYLILRK